MTAITKPRLFLLCLTFGASLTFPRFSEGSESLAIRSGPVTLKLHQKSANPVLRLESKALPLGWVLDPQKVSTLENRVLARLIQAEAHEANPHFRDDYRQTFIALSLALKSLGASAADTMHCPDQAAGECQAESQTDQISVTDYSQTLVQRSGGLPIYFIEASYLMYGVHPDKVWPAILARRNALLGQTQTEPPICEGAVTVGPAPAPCDRTIPKSPTSEAQLLKDERKLA